MQKKNVLRKQKARKAFTLIEIMIVLFILVMMASAAVVAFNGQRASAQRRTAILYVSQLAKAVELYQNDIGRPPTTEQGLRALFEPPSDLPNPAKWAEGGYLKANATAVDPWGGEYQYACPGSHSGFHFDIWSPGPDGVSGTDDDIGQWTTD